MAMIVQGYTGLTRNYHELLMAMDVLRDAGWAVYDNRDPRITRRPDAVYGVNVSSPGSAVVWNIATTRTWGELLGLRDMVALADLLRLLLPNNYG